MCQHNYATVVSDKLHQVEMGWSVRQQEFFLTIKQIEDDKVKTIYSSADERREYRRIEVYLSILNSYDIFLPGKMITKIAVDSIENVKKEPRWWN